MNQFKSVFGTHSVTVCCLRRLLQSLIAVFFPVLESSMATVARQQDEGCGHMAGARGHGDNSHPLQGEQTLCLLHSSPAQGMSDETVKPGLSNQPSTKDSVVILLLPPPPPPPPPPSPPSLPLSQGPKDKSYETKEWEFSVIDVSIELLTLYNSLSFIAYFGKLCDKHILHTLYMYVHVCTCSTCIS